MDNEDIGKPVSDYFGITSDAPTAFGQDFIEDKLKPFFKSDPIPETADGFPTLLFFPAGNKSFDPISVDADRTVVAFYKFLKKNASIPFKLQKPTSTPKSEAVSDAKESQESSSSTNDLRDEL